VLNEIIDRLELTSERLRHYVPPRKRLFFKTIPIDQARGALIYGLRGVGKTTFLLDTLNRSPKRLLYVSVDHPVLAAVPLYEVVSAIFQRGYEGVLVDEVHHAHRWSQHIKALYDDYPSHTIWISDSSNVILRTAVSDLSRRFLQFRIPLLSLREYLYLTEGLELEPVDPFHPDSALLKSLKGVNVLQLFHRYFQEGLRPIFLEGEYCARLKYLVEKSIYYDIPFSLPSFQGNHLLVMNAILGHLINAPAPSLNISGMCSQWGIGKEKLYHLLYVMEQSELLHVVRKKNTSAFSKGSKLFLSDPSIYSCFGGNLGTAREAFIVMSLREKFPVICGSDEEEYDFLVGPYKVEVGGKRKTPKGSDYILSDNIDIPIRNRIPLWVVGMAF